MIAVVFTCLVSRDTLHDSPRGTRQGLELEFDTHAIHVLSLLEYNILHLVVSTRAPVLVKAF